MTTILTEAPPAEVDLKVTSYVYMYVVYGCMMGIAAQVSYNLAAGVISYAVVAVLGGILATWHQRKIKEIEGR